MDFVLPYLAGAILGFVWGMVFMLWYIGNRIAKGHLPRILKEKKDKLLPLLEKS